MKKVADVLNDFITQNNFKLREDLGDGNGVYTDGTVIMRILNSCDYRHGKYGVDFDLLSTFDR